MIEANALQAATEVLGEAPHTVELLTGATSSEVYRLTLADRDVVLRLFLAERWQSDTAALSRREHEILGEASAAGLPVPTPISTLPGNGIIMSHLAGAAWLPEPPGADWIDAMAGVLRRIHASGISVPYAYASWNALRGHPAPSWWLDSGLWEAAQQLVIREPAFEPLFIHRDYHPLNLLWQRGRISGVVDWINACMGPPGVDVAHCRLNLALMYGLEAADAFLRAYQRHVPDYVHEPYWDVDDAFGVLPDVVPYAPWSEFGLSGINTETVRRRLEAFIRAAVSA